MSDESSAKERLILRTLRTVLGSIVRDAAPRPGVPSPLQEETIQSIRELFGLISEREAELADQAGRDRIERPYYADQPQENSVVTLHKPGKKDKLN